MEKNQNTDDLVTMVIVNRFILIKMKKNEDDIRFIKSSRYSKWDSSAFCWVVSHRNENHTQIRNYFGERLIEDTSQLSISSQSQKSIIPEAKRR